MTISLRRKLFRTALPGRSGWRSSLRVTPGRPPLQFVRGRASDEMRCAVQIAITALLHPNDRSGHQPVSRPPANHKTSGSRLAASREEATCLRGRISSSKG